MSRQSDIYSLVADIGGTNTRVALAQGSALLPETITRYRNADFPGLETVLARFCDAQGGVACSGACVALAGPVRNGRGTLTNLDWEIDEDRLRRAASAETARVFNDLQAQGHALDALGDGQIRTVLPGSEAEPEATRLVIGVGTGFNVAPVYHSPAGVLIPPAEAGHANLPIRSEEELRLMRFFETAHGFPAIEDMLSGRGLARVYAWLSQDSGKTSQHSAQEIVAGLEQGSDPLARQAAEMFVRMLGTVAGNLALIHLPFGGIYFSGGMARAFARHFHDLGFSDAFRDKGRFAGFMQNFGVHVIEDDYAALTGCACYLDATQAA